uniref:Uncharacterized protein n=1 Tax=Heterorhabditis bacteriophora TaxID=37862 RepID=A0A1I7W650_HETBA
MSLLTSDFRYCHGLVVVVGALGVGIKLRSSPV